MTGFGGATSSVGNTKLFMELRAVNHRHLEVRARLPRELAEHALFLEDLARSRLERGRVEIAVRTEGAALSAPRLDVARAESAMRELGALRDAFAPGEPLPLSLLSLVPDLFTDRESGQGEAIRDALQRAFVEAAKELDEMRSREGSALKGDFRARLGCIRGHVAQIAVLAPRVAEVHRRRLLERLEALRPSGVTLDPGRLEQEAALVADRADVAEEITRLGSHADQLDRELDGGDGPKGRKIDFVLQEMAREANTIAAKSADVEVTRRVVEIKVEIERLREQVQNVL